MIRKSRFSQLTISEFEIDASIVRGDMYFIDIENNFAGKTYVYIDSCLKASQLHSIFRYLLGSKTNA